MRVPTKLPRVQVTIDDELARVLALAARPGVSRARILRDLAISGAAAQQRELDLAAGARSLLLEIADGDDGFDLAASEALLAARGERLS